jgi:hypothetical protein
MLTRREFIGLGLSGLIGSPLANIFAQTPVVTKNTAKTCIFIFMIGGPSQLETWDPKEGPWSPTDLDIRSYSGGINLSHKLFPMLSRNANELVALRSIQAWEAIHERAHYYLQTSYPDTPMLSQQLPSLGAVVSFESESSRRPGDILPAYISLGVGDVLRLSPGFLPGRYAPFKLPFEIQSRGIPDLSRPPDPARFADRVKMLNSLEAVSTSSLGKTMNDAADTAGWAQRLLDSNADEIIRFDPAESERYGGNYFGDQCLLARNIVKADKGARFLALFHGNWDHHWGLFDANNPENLFKLSHEFDTALGNLIEELKALPAPAQAGGTALDNTLIIAIGDFGRTPGNLNYRGGRDHYRYAQVALLAGGGTRGPKAIGTTDETGGFILDCGWSEQRPIRMEDVTATIYSALGINWTKTIQTPLGWTYEYVRAAATNGYRPIDEVF